MADEYLRNLPVPFFSQRQNDYFWYKRYTKKEAEEINKPHLENQIKPNQQPISMDCRTCNITSVMMVMKYLGLTGVERTINGTTYTTPHTPKEFLTKYFDHEYDFLFTDESDKPTYEAGCLENWNNLRKIGQYVFGADCNCLGADKPGIALKNEEDDNLEIFCRLIFEGKDLASKVDSYIFVRTTGARR